MKFHHSTFILSISLTALSLFACSSNYALKQDHSKKAAAVSKTSYQPDKAERAFLDSLQHDTFNFFWQTTNPSNGLIPDRYPHTEFSSVAAVGFGLSSYLVGVKRGYISRSAAAERTFNTLKFLWEAPQGNQPREVTGYKGFYYHFLDMQDGTRYKDVELSTIDTALLLAGVLSAQSYFDQKNERDEQIRALADSIYRRVDWTWFQSKTHTNRLSMGWHPGEGFLKNDWHGYNEGMILYILALGSPTHPLPAAAWKEWTSTYQWKSYQGQTYVNFGPLFGYQYSHVWIDFRGIQDDYMHKKGINYFENSRRATLANRAYCLANPMQWKGYGKWTWGLTASDGPGYKKTTFKGKNVTFRGYSARGVSADYHVDDGTIVPTAAGGSVPFAPSVTIPTLKYLHDTYGRQLYGKYGFKDAFNLSYGDGWFDTDYLGIDQGPILLMIENYRSNFLWNLMKKSPYIQKGLKRAGFTGGWIGTK